MSVTSVLRKAAAVVILAAVAGLYAPSALASAYQIDARTEAQAYQIRAYRSTDPTQPVLLPRRRVVQYLGVNGFELVSGEDLSFESQLRMFADFGLPKGEAAKVDGLRGEDADLLYALVRYRRSGVDASLGRQTYVDVMDIMAFDGARVRYVHGSGFGGEAYFGFWNRAAGFLSSSVYQLDGTSESDGKTLGMEPVFGAKLLAVNLAGVNASAGYRRAMLGGKTDFERGALEVTWGRGKGLSLFSGAELDLFQTRLSQARLQARFDQDLYAVSAEVMRLSPTFSADSIWYYFAYAPRDELRLRGDLLPPGPFRLYVQGNASLYKTDLNPDLAVAGFVGDPAAGPSTALGGTAGASFRRNGVASAVDFTYRNGFGGRQLWVDLTGGFRPEGSRYSIDGRFSYANVRDAYNPSLAGNFYGAQVWGSYEMMEGARASLAVEQNVNPYTRSDTKVFLLFDLKAAL